ncbi:MAG: endopeptidase La [Chloroflexi bacterium]|nr:endopeptidase La [Ktedonobacteraceae bacterium]MBV8822518.1 endopeptidase La [Ktedonobacteraceae bacterium]MBV9021931.1 endopeptidase La [Ktedonobacteraceae bacterium]MBV9707820.1 endopeptidase La [Chloroflexota bacterium]
MPSEREAEHHKYDDDDHLNIPEILPVLPLRNVVVYPFAVQPLGVGQERSIRLIDEVMRGNRLVVLVAQKSADIEVAGPDDIFRIGTVARVGRMLRMPDNTLQIAVQGLERVAIDEFTQEKPYLKAKVTLKPDVQGDDNETEAIKRNVVNYFQRLVALVQNVPEGVAAATLNLEEARQVVYVIATFMQMDLELRQKLLELDSVREKLEQLSSYLAHELEILELGKKIQTQAQEEMGKMQREYLLREQLKAIQHELGEESEEQATINELRTKIDEAQMPEEALKEANRELSRLEKLPTVSPEYSIIRTYLELLVSLPWNKSTGEKIDVPYARQILDQDHYDLEKIKDRILEYLAVRRLKEERKAEEVERSREMGSTEGGIETEEIHPTQPLASQEAIRKINREPILCFVGPPGVGKTSLGQSIARALGRKFARMSLGGIRDEAEVRGHRRTYIGAMPGRIIQTLRRVESNDPVIMLDEVDKVGADWRGDPSSALLEVLDPEQNYNFRDNYLDLAFDLSSVMFIATANALEPIPAALRDRMEILELSGYTEEQKLHIARNYLLPKQIEANGLKKDELVVDDDTIRRVIRDYTREAGVRNLERELGSLCRKTAKQIAEGKETPVHITAERVSEYLGRQRFFEEAAERIDRPGIATGLAWTPVGGEILFIEAASMPGKGQLTLTGQLGDVMKESATAALSYVRSHAEELGLPSNVFEGQNVHIHIPAGSIPKDGPSAGVTMVTVLVSLASGRKVRSDVAMTGEITLRGKVMPIGGVKDKVLAAYRSGIRTVIMPKKNEQDLIEDLPKELADHMHFFFVTDIREVLDIALEPSTDKAEKAKALNGDLPRPRRRKAEKAAAKASQ